MFKAFVTGTYADGLRNTVGHLGLKQSISSHFFRTIYTCFASLFSFFGRSVFVRLLEFDVIPIN